MLTLLCSWTVITWVIVLGSSIIMFLWIVVYSFFESSDFVDEVIVLCGQSIFWFSVISAVLIALSESCSSLPLWTL